MLRSQYPVWEREQEAGKACPELGQTYQECRSGVQGKQVTSWLANLEAAPMEYYFPICKMGKAQDAWSPEYEAALGKGMFVGECPQTAFVKGTGYPRSCKSVAVQRCCPML